jgi:hypothetical protein
MSARAHREASGVQRSCAGVDARESVFPSPTEEVSLRRLIVGGIAALGLLGAAPVVAPAAQPAAKASIAFKSCSGRFVHGVINAQQKCLGRGEFCTHSADRQYHRYGFRCHRRDRNGRYHLS